MLLQTNFAFFKTKSNGNQELCLIDPLIDMNIHSFFNKIILKKQHSLHIIQ